jgi:hypothetical protein
MSRRYRISPQGPERLTDEQIAQHKDVRHLFYNYHKATKPLYKRPLYKEPWAFIALLIVVLLVILVAEAVEKEEPGPLPDTEQAP